MCATEMDSDYCHETNDKQIGICVSNDKAIDFVLQLYQVCTMTIRSARKWGNARKYANEELSSSVNIDRFNKLLNEVYKNI